MPLYLIDGHALVYRAYYAFIKRPLVNSKGEETSAVFGFAKAVLNLLDAFDPEYVAVVFDSAEKTFRHEAYTDYKATRKEMPEALIAQLPRINEFLEAMAIPTFALPGYEADDIIATFSRAFENTVPVRIISGDKDLLQLLSERTHVIRPGKSGLFEEEIDPAKLEAQTGLRTSQFVDFLSLTGDASDNVPGVRGIGGKTALKLMQDFETLDNLYANLDAVSPDSVKKKLADGRDSAVLSRELVTLDCNVPLPVRLEELARRRSDTDKLVTLLKELEFTQMLDSIPESRETRDDAPETGYRLIDGAAGLEELARELADVGELAVDIEASGLDPMRAVLAGIALAWAPGAAVYVPVKSVIEEEGLTLTPPREAPGMSLEDVKRTIGPVLADGRVKKIGQNIKYDTIVLAMAGMPLAGVDFDTMLASYCLQPGRRSHGLDALAADFLGHRMTAFKELFDGRAKKKDIREVPVARVADYACEDADMTLRLKHEFDPLLRASSVEPLFREVEMPLSEVLTEMEMAGVKLDVPFLESLSGDFAGKLGALEESIFALAGEPFNINSTARLQEILFGKLKLKPSRKTKTGFSTDVDVLKSLSGQHDLPRLLLEYRMLQKLKSTYIDALPRLVNPRTGRVHTSYNQAVTTTGRLSSSDPNLQNIPIRTETGREIRKAFIAGGDGRILLDADYSQVELRILAHLSQDAGLVKAFAEGGDVHKRTAAMLNGIDVGSVTDDMRSRAKTVNFGIIYGMGPRGLAQALDIDVAEARAFIDEYFTCYPGVKRFVDETIEAARRDGAVTTLLGRVRQVADIGSSDSRAQSFAERVAVNTPVQGTAADIIKVAMIKISGELKRRKLGAAMILQVHDELLFDLPAAELDEVREIVVRNMETAIRLSVPLRVDTGCGRTWLEAHA